MHSRHFVVVPVPFLANRDSSRSFLQVPQIFVIREEFYRSGEVETKGIEPLFLVCKTSVLPLNYAPLVLTISRPALAPRAVVAAFV